jgi:hypothetical protein
MPVDPHCSNGITSGCTCRRATGNGVLALVIYSVGCSFQLSIRFAAQVSRDR